MKEIQVRLVYVENSSPLENSNVKRTCHVEKKNDTQTLYIQHEFGGKKNHALFAKAVNEILGGCLIQLAELTDLLSCVSPSQIPHVLDDHDIARDYEEENEELGELVPHVYHYLIIQYPFCNFEEGERVAYGVESMSGSGTDWTNEEETIKYRMARVLMRANPADTTAGKFDFKSEYKIDFGSNTDCKTVSVLNIYTYHKDESGNLIQNYGKDNIYTSTEECDITKALTMAKRLNDVSDRRKVVRRLILHWLHCKNDELSIKMTEFLESEVIRLKVLEKHVTNVCMSHWRSRGRRERSTFNNYLHFSSGSRVSFYSATYEYIEPDKAESKRWIKQAKADLHAAKTLLCKCHALVCFHSQQCVEKLLKGVLYAKCGIPRQQLQTHDIHGLASSVKRLKGAPEDSLGLCCKLASYYLPTRYPDNQPKPKVPAEEYDDREARIALDVAESVFLHLEEFVNQE